MSLSFILWYTQTFIIAAACIICLFTIGTDKNSTPEKKYILYYCIFDLCAMILINASQFIPQFPFFSKYISALFALCEILLIPFYIQTIMGKPKKTILPIIIFIVIVPISSIFLKSLNSLTFLITNLYIGYFVVSYVNWLFKEKTIKNLKDTKHYYIIQGISVCYLGSIPYYISGFISHFASDSSITAAVYDLQYAVYSTLNICMFIFLIFAFLKTKTSIPIKDIVEEIKNSNT
jgi:hypothetical protein